jgi:hypothetical protein
MRDFLKYHSSPLLFALAFVVLVDVLTVIHRVALILVAKFFVSLINLCVILLAFMTFVAALNSHRYTLLVVPLMLSTLTSVG